MLALLGCNAETEPAQNIADTSATLRANVEWEDGEDVAYRWEWRPTGAASWTASGWFDPGPLECASEPCSAPISHNATPLSPGIE